MMWNAKEPSRGIMLTRATIFGGVRIAIGACGVRPS
jgi:hypothetical protein